MNFSVLQRTTLLAFLLTTFCIGPLALSAQDDGSNGPPKVLVIEREFTKPGKGGAMHERTESAYIHALDAAKARPHYLAMVSLTGPDRALFFSGYSSLASWEDEEKAVHSNAALSSELDRSMVADGDLLSQTDSSVWIRRDDLSLNTHNLLGMRYMELTTYTVRPGHEQQWEELVKMVMDGYKKGVPNQGWAMFELKYGAGGNEFLIVRALKSMADEDHAMTEDKGFVEAMGDEGLKKLDTLEAACVEGHQSNLFLFSPSMSRPPESWVKAEPDYWKHRTPAPARKAAAKPAPAAAQ
jgi:hypothetical protein